MKRAYSFVSVKYVQLLHIAGCPAASYIDLTAHCSCLHWHTLLYLFFLSVLEITAVRGKRFTHSVEREQIIQVFREGRSQKLYCMRVQIRRSAHKRQSTGGGGEMHMLSIIIQRMKRNHGRLFRVREQEITNSFASVEHM